MADTKTSAFTALLGASISASDLLLIADTSAAELKSITVQEFLTGILGSTGITGATVTTDNPLLNHAQTWNAAGVAFTGWKLNVTDTASAAASLLLDLQVGGASMFTVGKAGDTTLASAAFLAWSTDAKLFRDAANILAQRNGVNAQALRVYNTWTDASNYERAMLEWSANVLYIGSRSAGTGIGRVTVIESAWDLYLRASTTGWRITSGRHFLSEEDNLADIGASGANRPRSGYFGTSVIAPTFQTPDTTVAALPAAAAGNKGERRHVTDANATTFASTVAGGGANIVPVFSTGAAWIIA